MKEKIKLLLTLVLISVGMLPHYAANKNNESIYWIRPVVKDTVVKHNNTIYTLIKGSYVRVKEETDGDIYVGNVLLPTDPKKSTDFKYTIKDGKVSVNITDFNESQIPTDSLKMLIKELEQENDTLLAFNFKNLSGNGKLKVYSDGSYDVRREVKIGSNDTVPMSELGISSKDGFIILVPEGVKAAATYIPIAKIKSEELESTPLQVDEENRETGETFSTLNILKIIIAGLVVIILGLSIFIVMTLRKRRDCKDEIEVVSEPSTPNFDCSELLRLTKQVKEKTAQVSTLLKKKYEDIDGLINTLKSCRENSEELRDSIMANSKSVSEKYYEKALSIIQQLLKVVSAKKDFKKIEKLEDIKTGLNQLTIQLSQLTQEIKEDKELDFKPLDDVNDRLSDLKKTVGSKEKVEAQLAKVTQQLIEAKQERDNIIDKKVKKVQDECDSKIREEQRKAQEKITSAQRRAEQAEEKTRNIRNELNEEFNRERQRVKEEKSRIERTLTETRNELNTVSSTLRTTTDRLNQSERMVQNLTAETTSFKMHLSGVTDSQPYSERILRLVELAKRIQESATSLLDVNVDDKYFIYKPLALYFGKLNSINLPEFYTDVKMISRTGFVIKGTPLSTYDRNLPKSELESLTKNYFFTTYLKTYLDAIVVLNESLAGVHYLIDDVTPTDVGVFNEYRQQIETLARDLGISILTVRVYDSIGTNTDVQAVEIDAGYSKHGAILEIENCKVSLIGGTPSIERIKVKSQK